MGFIIMLIFNPSGALPGFFHMLIGGFNNGIFSVSSMLVNATPIILTGVALVFAFKSGLFNIGASGQMIMGAYTAVHIGVLWNIPAPFHWIVAIILGTIVGAIWGMIPGLLKAYRNTNEVVVTIMMNYIGTLTVIYLVKTFVYNSAYAKSLEIQSSAALPQIGGVFSSTTLTIGIFIAVLVAIVGHIVMHKTTLGFKLQAAGMNPDGAKYAGMNEKTNIITSMMISGGLAGLAGTLVYLVPGKNLGVSLVLLTEGFDGISVALLGLNEPIGALLAGLFLAHINEGGFFMQVDGFVPQITEIVIAVIVYVTAISAGIQLYMKNRKLKLEQQRLLKEEEASK
jgi:simple sugar transport system permease protein